MAHPSFNERFTRIYEKHYDEILAYCARRVSRHEADDATSEVFEVLWRRIDEVPTDASLPWLYAVAHRTLAHTWRTRGRWQRLLDRMGRSADTPFDSTADLVVRREQDRLVGEAVARLAPTDQEILRLAAWEGLTASQCARILDCSVAAAEQRLHRAKKRLARRLQSDPRLSPGVPARSVRQEGRT